MDKSWLSRLFKQRPFHTGLVLGGGGTRGFAHLGVIQALLDKGVKIDAISGVSAGAIVGALFASGMNTKEIMETLKDNDLMDLASLQFPKKGLMGLSKLEDLIRSNLSTTSFKELEIPFWVTVSNLNKGKVEYHNSGDLVKKVMASASIPILFSPIEIDGTTYVDGGLFDNLPVAPLKEKCKRIIGVNISPVDEIGQFENIMEIAARTFQLNDKSNTRKNKKQCSVYIEPPELCGFGLLDTSNNQRLFDIGYEYTKALDL